MNTRNIFIMVVALIWFPNCYGLMNYHMNALSTRAAFDFECPEEKLNLQQLNSTKTVMGVSGCGKRSTYVYVGGTWYRDTPGSVAIPQAIEVERIRRAEEEKRLEEEEERKEKEEEERKRKEEEERKRKEEEERQR